MQHPATPLPTVLLPTEVIEEIIDQASEDPRTLRRLTLLCKSLLTRARFHLFTSIVIRTIQHMDSSSEFLDSHPWVLPLVQKVTLSIDIPKGYSKRHTPLLDIIRVHLFTRLPNLRVWEMRTDSFWAPEPRLSLHRSTLSCYRTYGMRIQNLELAGIRIQGVSHFVRLISAFTTLQSLICSRITLPRPKEDQTSLHASELIPTFKVVSKPPTIRHLSVAMSVDIRLVEYLLRSSLATLASLSMSLCSSQAEGVQDDRVGIYFELLEEPLNRLSELSALKLVISGTNCWAEHNDTFSPVERIRWATRIVRRIRKPSPLRDVQVQFDMPRIADIGGILHGGLPPQLEACSELEELLLNFPSCNLQFCWLAPDWRRAGRPEFWSPTITFAFPKLNERGLLALPYTRPLLDPFGHEGSVTCLVALKDNRRIMTASEDGTIIVWDTELGIIEQQVLAHQGVVHSLGVSPNNQRIVSAGGDRGSIDQEKADETTFVACAWSPDGTLIASGHVDGTIRIWDALTFQQRGLLPIDHRPEPRPHFPTLLQWSADSECLAWRCGTLGDTILRFDEWTIWSPLAEEPPKKFPSHPTRSATDFSVYRLRFDPNSKYAVAALGDCRLFDNGENTLPAFGDGSSEEPYPGYIHIWDVTTGTVVADLEHARGVAALCFSLDGRSLTSVSGDGLVRIWDTDDWHETASLKIDGREMKWARFSPNAGYVATVHESANDIDRTRTFTLRLWSLCEGSQCVAVFTEHKEEILRMEFSPDGKFLASGDCLGIVHIRRLSNFIGH